MIIILIILLTLVAFRLLIPYVVLFVVNRKIEQSKEYSGRIQKVRLRIFKGVISFENLVLDKKDSVTQITEPFFSASEITITLQWIALFHKTIIGDILFERPELKWVAHKSEKTTDTSFHLKTRLQKMIPFRLNVQLNNGKIEYEDELSSPKIDLTLTDLQMQLVNVSNIKTFTDDLPAELKAKANVYEGMLSFNMDVYPLMEHLTFDMNMELKNINLVLLNDFLRAHAHIDVNAGTLSMYTEVAAKEGGFKGYIKPVISNLDVMGIQDRSDKLWNKLWEGFIAVVYQVIKNKSEDQVATKIGIEGKWDNPRINLLSGVSSILKNAFIHALQPSVDDVINMDSVRNTVTESKKFFKKILTGKTPG